jgi:hypothetical protein
LDGKRIRALKGGAKDRGWNNRTNFNYSRRIEENRRDINILRSTMSSGTIVETIT